jgi:hypothetical protein
MAMIGALGDIVFTVTPETVETINNATWSGSARITTHERHMQNVITEYTGRGADTMSFDILLTQSLNADIMGEIGKIFKAERGGTALPLIIGEKIYGKYRWLIQRHNTAMQYFDADGHLISAKVSVSLIEYT